MGVAGCLGERDGAIGRNGGVDAKLEELHSAAGEAEVTLEVKGDKAGMAGLGEDRVQMGQGGAGGVLKLVIRGVMGGGVVTGGLCDLFANSCERACCDADISSFGLSIHVSGKR